MDLSDDESPPNIEESAGMMFINNRMEANMLPPPPIPRNLCDLANENTGKHENGPMGAMPPMMMPMGGEWNEEWFNGRGPPQEMHRFPPPNNKRPHDFRGGFRGRGHSDFGEFRGRGRGRGFRGMRGMNNWVPNRGFSRGNRGFRGQFRGGF